MCANLPPNITIAILLTWCKDFEVNLYRSYYYFESYGNEWRLIAVKKTRMLRNHKPGIVNLCYTKFSRKAEQNCFTYNNMQLVLLADFCSKISYYFKINICNVRS